MIIPHNPEENDVAERVNDTIMDLVRELLFTANLDGFIGLILPEMLF